MKTTIFFDIETGPNMARVQSLIASTPFVPEDVKVGNLKDPAKIEAKIEEARSSHAAAIFDRAALNPATAEVLCIQFAVGDSDVKVIELVTEGDSLKIFWDILKREGSKALNWTGSNTPGNFDLNMMVRRSWALGVKVPVDLRELTKGGDVAQHFLAYADRPSYCGLERAAKELGIPTEETPVKGADFYRWWQGSVGVGTAADQRAAARHYAEQDVKLLREIAKRILP